MAVRPPKRPAPVAALGSLQAQGVGEDTGEATDRALGSITDAIEALRQRVSAPTVNRVTMTESRPLTNLRQSFYVDGGDAWYIDSDGVRIQLTANGAVNATSGGGGGTTVIPSTYWFIQLTANGAVNATSGGGGGTTVIPSTYWFSPIWTAGSSIDTRGPTNDQCRAIYLGRAPQDLTTINIFWGQTAGGTITYAEMGVATGTMLLGSTPTLTLRGFVDVTTEWGAVGNYLRAIPVTSSSPITAGTDIWACYSVSFSAGAPTIAVSNVPDRLDSGSIVRRNTTRISANLGAPLAFVLDSGATPAWIAFSL